MAALNKGRPEPQLRPAALHPPWPPQNPRGQELPQPHTFDGIVEDAGLGIQGQAPPGILQHLLLQGLGEVSGHLVHHGDELLHGLS